jgi:hypothetical protein
MNNIQFEIMCTQFPLASTVTGGLAAVEVFSSASPASFGGQVGFNINGYCFHVLTLSFFNLIITG